jgi:hypothetical protein
MVWWFINAKPKCGTVQIEIAHAGILWWHFLHVAWKRGKKSTNESKFFN